MSEHQMFKISPLGGVGEIGSNMTVFETKNHIIIVDYGILFPYDDFFDINYLIVDYGTLDTTKEITLFITHGHEDHIGAIQHLVKAMPSIRIVAPRFAKELIRTKLEPRKLPFKVEEYTEETIYNFDQIELHPVHVTHSIPDTFGIILKDSKRSLAVLFISDFKYDLNPLFEKPFNTQKIIDIFTSAQKRYAFLDSTNILVPGATASESDLSKDIEAIMQKKQRTFITMFSSNIYRMKNILELAKKNKRTVTTIGRSIQKYLAAAEESNLIDLKDYPVKDFDSISNYNDERLIYIITGSQGEYLGALKRIANGDQKNITISSKDLFVFSSKPIPGNEKGIYRLYNQLTEKDAEIITFREKLIHASGHPAQEDLRALITKIKPTDYIPIHGETYFLKKHKQFVEKNFPSTTVHLMNNFEGIDLSSDEVKYFNLPIRDPLLIHGNDHIIEKEKISERRKIACNGVVFITISQNEKKVLITTKGLPLLADEKLPKLNDFVDYMAFEEFKKRDYDYKVEQVRIKVRNFYKDLLGYKPITIIQML